MHNSKFNFKYQYPLTIKNDEVEKIQETNKKEEIVYSDEYIEKNWKDIVSNALSSYDEDYYKSEQYKIDRGNYLMEKYK